MYKRSIELERCPTRSLFLWGQRKTGKSTLVKELYEGAEFIDLLQTDMYQELLKQPSLLRERLTARPPKSSLVVVDEIQKIPALLDEVHWLIETKNLVFILLGSSARKVRKGHANLLGGRALRYELYGLSARELGRSFDIVKLLNKGYLPEHYDCPEKTYPRLIASYVGDYLKEEIAAEGLVRNLQGFAQFLDLAALSDTEQLNFSTFARDTGFNVKTVREYFQILIDTLVAWELPAFQSRPKRRTVAKPKFYFSDIGVVNHLARRKSIAPGTELFGKAFENWIAHELRLSLAYQDVFSPLTYWRLSSGLEVDFVIGDAEVAIESKATSKVTSDHLKGLRAFRDEYPEVSKLVIVCLEKQSRLTDDGILILPYPEFIENCWPIEKGLLGTSV